MFCGIGGHFQLDFEECVSFTSEDDCFNCRRRRLIVVENRYYYYYYQQEQEQEQEQKQEQVNRLKVRLLLF